MDGITLHRLALGAAYLALLMLAVPWYWSYLPVDPNFLFLGMPIWFNISVFASVFVSVITMWQLRKPWAHETEHATRSDPSGNRHKGEGKRTGDLGGLRDG